MRIWLSAAIGFAVFSIQVGADSATIHKGPQQQRGGYYTPVQPQTYHRRCGTVATDVCEVPVTIPPNATGEQLYQMAKKADASGRKGEGLSYLKASAERGYAMAQGVLGMALLTGKGAMKDTASGVALLEKAAEQGNRGAQVELGMAFEDGELVRGDQAKAVHYLKAAAAQHHSEAEYRLGLDYEIGRGVGHDRALAIEWLRKAASDGAPRAGATANALAKARVAWFHSMDELDAYLAPPVPHMKLGACGPVPTFRGVVNQKYGISDQYPYCSTHPGCPWLMIGGATTFYCPN